MGRPGRAWGMNLPSTLRRPAPRFALRSAPKLVGRVRGGALALLSSILLAACASAPVLPTETESSVRLRFDWKEEGDASVRVLRSTTDISPRGHYLDQVRMSYRLQSRRGDDEAIRVSWSDLTIDLLPQRWIPRTMEMVALEVGQADFTVSGSGNFVGISEPAATQAQVASWVAQLLAREAPPQGVQSRLVELFSEEAIAHRTANFWDDLVGVWSGGVLEVGRTYAARDTIAVEGLGGIPVEMEVEVHFAGWVACDPKDRGPPACVRLELFAQPAPEQRPLLMQFTSALFPSDPDKEVRIEHGLELVTEPDGLRPRWMRSFRVVEIPLQGTEPIVIADERDLFFDWGRAR